MHTVVAERGEGVKIGALKLANAGSIPGRSEGTMATTRAVAWGPCVPAGHPARGAKPRAVSSSAIDGGTPRHRGYAVSQRLRKRVEEIFGRMKTVGGFLRTRYRASGRESASQVTGPEAGPSRGGQTARQRVPQRIVVIPSSPHITKKPLLPHPARRGKDCQAHPCTPEDGAPVRPSSYLEASFTQELRWLNCALTVTSPPLLGPG